MEKKEIVMVFWNDLKLPFEQLEILIRKIKSVTNDVLIFSKTEEGRLAAQCLCANSYVQFGETESEKAHNAFLKAFLKRYEHILLIDFNTEIFSLNPSIIRQAFDMLEKRKVLIGRDGERRMLLMGMMGFIPGVFEEKFYLELKGGRLLEESTVRLKNIIEISVPSTKRTSIVFSLNNN